MKCSFKTMLQVAAVMIAAAGFAYLTFEEARATILASLPVLVALICPVSMLVMMKFMHSGGKDDSGAARGKPESSTREGEKPLEGMR